MKIKKKIKIPDVYRPMFQHSMYKIWYGGRGAGRSWTSSIMMVLKTLEEQKRILCGREIQDSIKESVHRLIQDTIERMGVESKYETTEKTIRSPATKSYFTFIGLAKNITKVKSYEGYDLLHIEEGEKLTEPTMTVFFPTIRKTTERVFDTQQEYDEFLEKNPALQYPEFMDPEKLTVKIPAEIWILFNPEFEDDPVYQRFIVNTPDSCIKVHSTYKDNPWLPAKSRKEAEDCKKNDPEKYRWIWLGEPKGSGLKIYAVKFDEKVHVRNESREMLFGMLRRESIGNFMGIDPHSKYFPFCIWLAVVLNEHNSPEYIIYNEWPSYDYLGDWYCEQREKKKCELSLKELAEIIYSHDGIEYGLNINTRYADTRYAKGAGGDNVMTNAVGMIATWARPENGSMVLATPAEKMIDIQRMNVLTDLDYNRLVPIGPFNRPKITVAPWCRNTINMFMHHRETRDGKEEDKKRKCISDALRILYAGISERQFKQPVERKYKPLRGKSWMGR